ncbi:MAG: serine hydrolase [Planctomycetes bacterium]|nr:serine hydrolase [Planctomycetota bacterium]MCB9889877.1 serine hydrolase [Planctomycetota bacterium]
MPRPQQVLPIALPALALLLPAQTQKAGLDPRMAQIAAAYAAKVAASAVFVSGRELDSVLAEELSPDRPLEMMIRPFLRLQVDRDNGTVTATLGKARATACRTSGLGCTLTAEGVEAGALAARSAPGPEPAGDPDHDWPRGDRGPAIPPDADIDATALADAVTAAFAEREGRPAVRTRAVVVVHRGRLVAERYATGYDASMALPGWSMSKTITNALVGIRVRQGKLDLQAPVGTPRWPKGDPRHALRLHHLMTMTPGLAWNESYEDPASDVLRMLFASNDHAEVQASHALEHDPGAFWRYSSGVTNLICRELRSTFTNDADYWAFPRRALFNPLHMRSAVLETDPSGTFVGSSYGFATARDWARFGLLYAQDGVFDGQRILPEGWVAASAAAAPSSGGRFGRQIWLNADPDGDGPQQRMWADLPADLLHMDGHEGQYVIVLPTEQLVIVRLGCAKAGGFDLHGLIREVLRACGGAR